MVWWQQQQHLLQQGDASEHCPLTLQGDLTWLGSLGEYQGTALKEMGKDSKEWELWKNKLSYDLILTLFALVLLSVHPLVARNF